MIEIMIFLVKIRVFNQTLSVPCISERSLRPLTNIFFSAERHTTDSEVNGTNRPS